METNQEAKLKRMKSYAGADLSENTYNAVIGLTLLWGIAINFIMSYFLTPYIIRIDIRVVIVVYLIASFACAFIIHRSDSALVSFLAFTGLAIAMGLLLTDFVAFYTSSQIYNAFLTTGIIVVSMILLSVFFPAFFLSLGRVLIFALLGSLIIELICSLIFHMPTTVFDYIVVIIFAGYIGFDWAKSQVYPKNMNNAIDCASDIYIDIVNIFVRILSIMGNKDN